MEVNMKKKKICGNNNNRTIIHVTEKFTFKLLIPVIEFNNSSILLTKR